MQPSEDRSIYDKVVNAIFDKEMLSLKDHHQSSIQYTDVDTEVRDYVVEVTREVFRQHCAKHIEIIPIHMSDDFPQFNRYLC